MNEYEHLLIDKDIMKVVTRATHYYVGAYPSNNATVQVVVTLACMIAHVCT